MLDAMPPADNALKPHGLALMFGWRRVLLVLIVSTVLCVLHSPSFATLPTYELMGRELIVGFATLIGFGLFEQWPSGRTAHG